MKNKQKVFVWVAYGDITIYDATSLETMKELFEGIVANIKSWGLDDVINKANIIIINNTPDIAGYIKAINVLMSNIDLYSHESFEHLTGFNFIQVIDNE